MVFEQRAAANAMKSTSQVPKANVLGVGVDAINLAEATELILEAVRRNRKGYVCHRRPRSE